MSRIEDLLVKRLLHIDCQLVSGLPVMGSNVLSPYAAQSTLGGAFALPGMTEKVTAELVVRESGPLTRELQIAITDKATGQSITRFDKELTQELHVLATDSAFSSFVHQHADKVGFDGRFRVSMQFPKPGIYYIYADAVPRGLGQQVIRFEVPVGIASGQVAVHRAACAGAVKGSDGPYTIKLEASAFRARTESMVMLTISKDGEPATDLGLYLGVPAHAVFVSTDDLGYIHAHARAADAPTGHHASHGSHDNANAVIPATLMLHATPPRAGRYALWIQFKGGGQVRTVSFVVTVPDAPT